MSDVVSASDWMKGITLSIIASFIGGASKLALRKSWLIIREFEGAGETVDDPASTTTAANTTAEETNITLDATQQNQEQQHHDELLGQTLRVREPLTMRMRKALSIATGNENDDGSNELQDEDALDSAAEKRRIIRISNCLSYSGMIGMSLLNPACGVLAMQYASPSILAPFSGLTLVWVILFSYPVIAESPSSMQVLAACLIVLGEVIVAVFGDHTNNEDITAEQLRESYLETGFLIYCGVLACYLLLMAYWAFAKTGVLRKFAWGTASGAITGMQNFLKDSLTLLQLNSGSNYSSLPWYFAVFGLLAVGTAFSGLLALNQCMKRYDVTYSAATFVGSFVVSASIMSVIHYNTIANLDGLTNYILYPSGLGVLMLGVMILVCETSKSEVSQSHQQVDSVEPAPARKERSDTGDSQTPFFYQQVEPIPSAQNQVV